MSALNHEHLKQWLPLRADSNNDDNDDVNIIIDWCAHFNQIYVEKNAQTVRQLLIYFGIGHGFGFDWLSFGALYFALYPQSHNNIEDKYKYSMRFLFVQDRWRAASTMKTREMDKIGEYKLYGGNRRFSLNIIQC